VIRRAQEVSGVQRVVSHVLKIDDPRRTQTARATEPAIPTAG
jgi:hypothetical protein